nr:hypothetical protein [Tanacetum cinerariifolium]
MDEEGVVTKNKARLVAKGYIQEEGIDYAKTFAPVRRLEPIRIFIAYASYMGFIVYQMDMISAFMNGKIFEKVYVEQPPRFESRVFVNETQFRGMIGSLMYLTASRPDIRFSTSLCARYQANPKESYLVFVKRIFRYLKATPNASLCYPKGSCFDLKVYTDSDYVGCNLDRKAEAEYVAAVGCCAQVLWIKSQFANYDVLYDK